MIPCLAGGVSITTDIIQLLFLLTIFIYFIRLIVSYNSKFYMFVRDSITFSSQLNKLRLKQKDWSQYLVIPAGTRYLYVYLPKSCLWNVSVISHLGWIISSLLIIKLKQILVGYVGSTRYTQNPCLVVSTNGVCQKPIAPVRHNIKDLDLKK